MNKLDRLREKRVIPVIRKADEENILLITEALINGGITAIEITAETPRAAAIIEKVAEAYQDRIMVGAGTVLDPETAMEMIRSGADFIVSPTLNVKTIHTCNRYGVPCIPGVFTPTEIQTAMEAGAPMVKLFPANIVGADYIKNVQGPLPQASIMATGGIHLGNMGEYLEKGAEIVGIGSQLVKPVNLNTEADYRDLTSLAKAYMEKAAVTLEKISL